MAVYRKKVAGASVEIHDVDHGPPHCHISGLRTGASAQVNLLTLEVVKPRGLVMPKRLARVLKQEQETMLEAWESVISVDRGE